MKPRVESGDHDATTINLAPAKSSVVSLTDARRLSRRRDEFSYSTSAHKIDEVRELLDRGQSSEAESRLLQIINTKSLDESLRARARCLLSTALEMVGRYREALEAVQAYETPDSRARFDAETESYIRVRLGLSYNYTGDHPKAIALLKAALRETSEDDSATQTGAVYNALARVYRSINEYTIARDHAHKALEHYRRAGDWRGLAEAYFSIAMADAYEGNYDDALDNHEQALKLIGERSAPFLLGSIYSNMAGACWFLKRPHDGIRYLEKGIDYYERTEHKANAATGYNNLGINLTLIGKWDRAHEALKRALALASEVDERGRQVPMILDSLGELHMLRGDLEEAQVQLERAAKLATENGNKWYAGQAMRTLARCRLAMGNPSGALVEGEGALAVAERIGDRQAVCESSLILAEAYLQSGNTEECSTLLQKVLEETADSATDLAMAGEAQRIFGMLSLARQDATLAAHHFGRSVSIFEMLGDRYRNARGHYWLGCAYAIVQPECAAEQISIAIHAFRELGARLDLERAEQALAGFEPRVPERRGEGSALSQLLTLRLAEAVASRELLLRELAAVIHQETKADRVLIAEMSEDNSVKVVCAHGCTNAERTHLAQALHSVRSDPEREQFAATYDTAVIQLRSPNAPPATLLISPPGRCLLPGGAPIEPLLRVVELGMDVCSLRSRARAGRDPQDHSGLAGASLMPGFIHSSPAMTSLVDEVHKIRSSDVTVLVTGESGTGKELVARAIHALSSRRSKVFVPFNCTAVPKELSEGYLFGYRRGAFTGAVADSAGVIRTAAGGTLFLDEIGDLPLDVQPKILRFLQEGEIQPLGEQRPIKVDVRIIAATNRDLEQMVAEGRFREDLYYRLNVIRLRVPPLKERRSEIPTIVNYYINHYSDKFGRRDIHINSQAVDLLMVCDWPGNVRQLCNEIQRVVARAEDGTLITPNHLSPELKRTSAVATPAPVTPLAAATGDGLPQGLTLAGAMAELERRMIADSLRKHNGNISRAARELGLTRRGLYLKLERYSITAASA
ncbi:MAG TPA: sigma 54-interacting transcriptional regulator [Pyrinomonadaceae bacterium]|nr:sigma 54-interacting transcriptional regulator [Pyrinomonadaceae bacterium]